MNNLLEAIFFSEINWWGVILALNLPFLLKALGLIFTKSISFLLHNSDPSSEETAGEWVRKVSSKYGLNLQVKNLPEKKNFYLKKKFLFLEDTVYMEESLYHSTWDCVKAQLAPYLGKLVFFNHYGKFHKIVKWLKQLESQVIPDLEKSSYSVFVSFSFLFLFLQKDYFFSLGVVIFSTLIFIQALVLLTKLIYLVYAKWLLKKSNIKNFRDSYLFYLPSLFYTIGLTLLLFCSTFIHGELSSFEIMEKISGEDSLYEMILVSILTLGLSFYFWEEASKNFKYLFNLKREGLSKVASSLEPTLNFRSSYKGQIIKYVSYGLTLILFLISFEAVSSPSKWVLFSLVIFILNPLLNEIIWFFLTPIYFGFDKLNAYFFGPKKGQLVKTEEDFSDLYLDIIRSAPRIKLVIKTSIPLILLVLILSNFLFYLS